MWYINAYEHGFRKRFKATPFIVDNKNEICKYKKLLYFDLLKFIKLRENGKKWTGISGLIQKNVMMPSEK